MKKDKEDPVVAGRKRAERLGLSEDVYFRYMRDGEFVDCNVVEDIEEDIKFVCPTDSQVLYRYDADKGVYTPDGDCVIKKWLSERINPLIKKAKREEIIEKIKIKNFIDPKIINSEKDLIIMENGIYNILDNTFVEHTPNIITTVKLPILYNPDAVCPLIDKFLKDLVYEKDVRTLYEIMGYSLYRSYPIRKAFIFYGETKNGKSTLINLIQKFLGEGNYQCHDLRTLENDQWCVKSLAGMMANMCADISGEDLETSARFRELVGNDIITVRTMRSENTFSFRNYAKLIFSANEVPMPKQDLNSYYNRIMTITFPNTFEGSTDDKKIIEKIVTPEEFSGLFNACVEHLKLLLERGKFSGTLSDEINKEQYKRLCNPLQAFCEACLDKAPSTEYSVGGFIFDDALRIAANIYFHDNGLPPLDNSQIAKKMQKVHGFNVSHSRKQEGGNRGFGFYGIKFKPGYEIKIEIPPLPIKKQDGVLENFITCDDIEPEDIEENDQEDYVRRFET